MEAPVLRRSASALFVLALLVVLFSAYVALVYHGDIDVGTSWVVSIDFVQWIYIFLAIVGILFLMLVVLLLIRPSESGPILSPVPTTAGPPDITLKCNNCKQVYLISDTGDRPLLHTCPHCGFTDRLEGEPVVAEAIPSDPSSTPATAAYQPPIITKESGDRVMILRCSACGTNFEVPYTNERPLIVNCDNCGRRGILRGGDAVAAEA